MPHRNGPITCIASEDIAIYSTVVRSGTQGGNAPKVSKSTATTDIIIGVTLDHALAGELVAVHPVIQGGVVPVRITEETVSAWPGVGLSLSTAAPGTMTTAEIVKPNAYILRASVISGVGSIAYAIFVRTKRAL